MPLKPIFDKAPLTKSNSLPLCAGLVRMESAAMHKLYSLCENVCAATALESAFRLACLVAAKPAEAPAASKIRALLAAQKEDGSFPMSLKDSVALLRAAWALYEFETKKAYLEAIARWCAYAVQHWDELMADDEIWAYSADLLEVLENLYRVSRKQAVLTLCERLATQSMGWSSVLNTISSQRPTSRSMAREELMEGLNKEQGSREGYYTHFYRTNHAEALADGARSTMAKGIFSGSATELNATRNGWERLSRYHGAVCGGLTSDEMLEGTSPAEAISTAALGAWAEALSAAAMSDGSEWAWSALERMVYNAMPACLNGDKLCSFQRVNTLGGDVTAPCYAVSADHEERALVRLARGYAALASAAVTACSDGASINLYLPGRFAIPVGDDLLVLTVSTSAKKTVISVHCKQEIKAAVSLRMPAWSRNIEITINGADNHADVKGNVMAYDRLWNDGDVIIVNFEQTLNVLDGHHQGKYILRGPVLMALEANKANWQQAFVSIAAEDNAVTALLDRVESWKLKGEEPADLPVLPETAGKPEQFTLVPYVKPTARIAMFPGRKQA